MQKEPEKVIFPDFMGAMDNSSSDFMGATDMVMCFPLHDYPSNMKVYMTVFQLKGKSLLWWKTLLPQLNMVVKDVQWELLEE
jgi:hypothetical protein